MIQDHARLPAKLRRIFIDLCIQNHRRKAEYLIGNEDFEGALKRLQDARDVYEASSKTLIDWRTLHNLKRAWKTVPTLKRAFMGLPQQKLVDDFSIWLWLVGSDTQQLLQIGPSDTRPTDFTEVDGDSSVPADGPPNRGRLADLRTSFGFIEMGGGKRSSTNRTGPPLSTLDSSEREPWFNLILTETRP